MAAPNRSKYEDDIQSALARVSVRPEVPQVDIAKAQTLARTTSNPDAQRQGEQMLQQDQRNKEYVARQTAMEQRQQAAEADRQARAQAKEQEAIRARGVRAGAAQGMKTVTDIETGKRSIAQHPDGAPVYKAEPIGQPIETPTVNKIGQAIPIIGDVISTGAAGRPAAYTGTELSQTYRDDRGGQTTQPLPTKTDAKTGDVSSMVADPVSGRQVERTVGNDPAVAAKVAKDMELEQRRQALALRDNGVKQARTRFDPQWEPAKKEFDAAEKALNSSPPTFRPDPRTGRWQKIDPKTDSPVAFDNRELAVWQKEQATTKARYEAAKKAHDALFPQAENLNRNEREVQDGRLKLAEEKIRHDAGLPEDDGGAASFLAKAENGMPNEADSAVMERMTPAGKESPVTTTDAAGNVTPANASATTTAGPKPLIDPSKPELFTTAFSGLKDPASLSMGEPIGNTTPILMNGTSVGSIDVDQKTKTPYLTIGGANNADADLRQLVAFGGTTGVPVYMRQEGKKDIANEAQWVASVFSGVRDSQANQLDPQAVTKQLGATPRDIAAKVNRGDLSVQHGEAMMKDLYGSTLKADDPLDKATFGKWIESADPATKEAWSSKDTAAKNEVLGNFINEWYVANRWKPGVNFKSRVMAEKAMKLDTRTGEKISQLGSSLLQSGGSMVGMLSAPFMATALGAQAGLSGDDDVKTALFDTISNYGRESRNVWRGWEANRQKWFTGDGEKKHDELQAAIGNLRSQIGTQDVYPDGPADPRFIADYKQKIDAVTNAALAIHNLNPEKGWEITREDLDPSSNPAMAKLVNGYMLTGDSSLFDAYRSALLEDHGTRQAQGYLADLTAGQGPLMASIIAGANAAPEEVLTEIASTLLTAGAGKAIFGGAKLAEVAAAGGKAAESLSRANRFRLAALGLKHEAKALGMVADTLASPASKLGKASNFAVKALKTGAVDSVTEFGEEAAMEASDRNATPMSIAAAGTMGAVSGFFMGPLLAGPAVVMDKAKSANARAEAAAKFANSYNQAASGTPGFSPVTREQAEVAMALVPDSTREQLMGEARDAGAELSAAVQAAKGSNDPAALDALSRAQARTLQATDALATDAAMRTEAVKSIQSLPTETKDFASALAKVAGGRPDLLTSSERTAAASRQTADGQPYFATVNGQDVVTDAGRADALQNFPEIGRMIQTTESRAIFESSLEQPNEISDNQTSAGQLTGDNSTSGQEPRLDNREQGIDPQGDNASQRTQGLETSGQKGNGTTVTNQRSNPAALDAGEYAAFQAVTPEAHDIPTVVRTAFAGNQPVSVTMARAASMSPPRGYSKQGNMLVPPAVAPVTKNTAVSNTAREIAGRVRANAERAIPGLKGRIKIAEQSASRESGGVVADSDGSIRIILPDIEREIRGSTPKAFAEALEQLVVRHEAVHVVQYDAIRDMWQESGSEGDFGTFFQDWYGQLYGELSPDAIEAARNIYGPDWDAIPSDANKAAELVRMLVEAKLDPAKAGEFSELFRAVAQQRSPKLIETLRRAIDILKDLVTGGKLSAAAQTHVEQITDLYNALVSANGSTADKGIVTRNADEQLREPSGIRDAASEAGTPPSERGVSEESSSDRGVVSAAVEESSPVAQAPGPSAETLKVVGDSIRDAIAENIPLQKNKALRIELDDLVFDMAEALEQMPAEQRRSVADEAISAWVEENLPKPKDKKPRSIDTAARRAAYQAINSGDFPALAALAQSGTKLAPRPSLLAMIVKKRRRGEKLTNAEIALFENDPQYNGALFQNQFANSGNGKVAREALSMITARQGEGTPPNVMAGYLGDGLTADDMWQAIGDELNAIANGQKMAGDKLDPNRERTNAEIAAEADRAPEADPATAQAENFEQANQQTDQSTPLAVDEFTKDSVGSTITVGGEPMTIAAVNMDSLGLEVESVELQDGSKFGRQVLDSGETVFVEGGEAEDGLFSSSTALEDLRAYRSILERAISQARGQSAEDAVNTLRPFTIGADGNYKSKAIAQIEERLAASKRQEEGMLAREKEKQSTAQSTEADKNAVDDFFASMLGGPTPAQPDLFTAPDLKGEKIDKEWTRFSDESQSLGIPRDQMPQIPNESRGALTQFLAARGIANQSEEVLPGSLHPTQEEYSPAKVKKAVENRKKFGGQGRALLISADNYVVDGHHQWMAALEDAAETPLRVTRFNAPISEVLPLTLELPSATSAKAFDEILAATRAPDATEKLGDVRAGKLNALGAYRALTAKRERTGKLSATEEEQLLSAEKALGQKLAIDMDAVKGDAPAAPEAKPAAKPTIRPKVTQQSMSLGPETDRNGQGSLFSSASKDAVEQVLKSMPPIYGNVFQAITSGQTPAEVTAKYGITEKAVTNILSAVQSRIDTALTATGQDGLKPVKIGDKIAGGRPDLAGSTIPEVAAIHQIRNEDGMPGTVDFDEITTRARAAVQADPQAAMKRLVAKRQSGESFTLEEVAEAKEIVYNTVLNGEDNTPQRRLDLALLATEYIDQGSEDARKMGIRRDPNMSPAQRAAQYIATELYTPDDTTRKNLKKLDQAGKLAVMDQWMKKVDKVKAALASQGIDLDATLGAFREEQEAKRQAAEESPRVAAAIDDSFTKLSKREKKVVRAIRNGARMSSIIASTGMTRDEILDVRNRFDTDIRKSMADRAKQFMKNSLASSPTTLVDSILADLGWQTLEDFDDTVPGYVPPEQRGRRKTPRVPEPSRPLAEPSTTLEEFAQRDPATWRTLFDEEMKDLQPQNRVSFEEWAAKEFPQATKQWQAEMDLLPAKERMSLEEWAAKPLDTSSTTEGADLFPEPKLPINETQGTFDLSDPVAMRKVRDAFSTQRASWKDKILEFWRASVLSGPLTSVVNLTSNAAHFAYRGLPRRAAEAAVNSVLSKIGLGSQEAATFGEFAAMVREIRKGTQLASRQAINSWRTGEDHIFEKYATQTSNQTQFDGKAEGFARALDGKIGDIMHTISFDHLRASDDFIKFMSGHIEAAAQAHRIARVEEKLTGESYEKRIAELMEPGSKAWERALDEAKKITFDTDFDINNPQAIHRIDQLADLAMKGRAMPWIGAPLTFILPFIRIPTNVLKTAIEMSPANLALSVFDAAHALKVRYSKGMPEELAKQEAAKIYNRARLVREVTNQSLGLAAYFTVAAMVKGDDDDKNGLPFITGTAPAKGSKRGERDNQYAVMPPQSIRIGDKFISYKRIEPFATIMAGMADFAREVDRNGGVNQGVVTSWLGGFRDQMVDKSFLQGLGNLADAWSDPERFGTKLATNIVTGFVPNLIRQPLKNIDPMMRDTQPRSDEGFFESMAKAVGYSVVPQGAPPKVDVWGEPIRKDGGGSVTGSSVADAVIRLIDPTNLKANPDIKPIDAYIFRYNLSTKNPSERISITPIDSSFQMTVPGEKDRRNINLTPAEQMQANVNAGKEALAALEGQDWRNAELTQENAERIMETVRNAQKVERARLRMDYIAKGLPPAE